MLAVHRKCSVGRYQLQWAAMWWNEICNKPLFWQPHKDLFNGCFYSNNSVRHEENALILCMSLDECWWCLKTIKYLAWSTADHALMILIHQWSYYRMAKLLSQPNATLAPQTRQAKASGHNLNYLTLAPQARLSGEILNYLLSPWSDILYMIIVIPGLLKF